MASGLNNIVFAGAGITAKRHCVRLIDPWREHVERIQREGMRLGGTEGGRRIPVEAL